MAKLVYFGRLSKKQIMYHALFYGQFLCVGFELLDCAVHEFMFVVQDLRKTDYFLLHDSQAATQAVEISS